MLKHTTFKLSVNTVHPTLTQALIALSPSGLSSGAGPSTLTSITVPGLSGLSSGANPSSLGTDSSVTYKKEFKNCTSTDLCHVYMQENPCLSGTSQLMVVA